MKWRVLIGLLVIAFLAEEIWSLLALGGQPSGSGAGWSLASALPSPVLALSLSLGFAALLLVPGLISSGDGKSLRDRGLVVLGIAVSHIYFSHELLQLAVGDGHAVGLHGLFDHGGWILIPYAALLASTVLAVCAGIKSLTKERHLALDVWIDRTFEQSKVLYGYVARPFDSGYFSTRSGRAPPLILV